MNKLFIKRYGFDPPKNMNSFQIENAIYNKDEDSYFSEIFKKKGKYSSIKKKGYSYYEEEINNIYVFFYGDNFEKIITSINLSDILMYGCQTLKPFKIGYFKKLNILAITTNVPTSYLDVPKTNKKTLIIQNGQDHLFTEQFSGKVILYKVKENYIYKKYESIEYFDPDDFILTLDYEKIFENANKKGYKNLDKFIIKYVLI